MDAWLSWDLNDQSINNDNPADKTIGFLMDSITNTIVNNQLYTIKTITKFLYAMRFGPYCIRF